MNTFCFLSLPKLTFTRSSNLNAFYLHPAVTRRTWISNAALLNGDSHVRPPSPKDDDIRVGGRRGQRSPTMLPISPFSPGIPGLPLSPCREAIKKRCRQCQEWRKGRILPILSVFRHPHLRTQVSIWSFGASCSLQTEQQKAKG